MPKNDENLNDDDDELIEDQDVETEDNSEDETLNDDSEDDNEDDDSQDEDDSTDDDDSDDDDADKEDETEFTKAFTQIKGDTLAEYVKNLEDSYRNSSAEGKLKAKEAKETQERIDKIAAVVASNPELAKLINDAAGSDVAPTTDPALLHARNQMEEQMTTDYNKFVESHPELDSDPELQEKVLAELATFGEIARKNGKILTMAEGLRKAWISLELDKDDSKETVLTKAKDNASKSKTNNSNKKSSKKPTLSPEQIEAGKKFGLTEKQMLEQLGNKKN